jgi:O-antigen/teichoic acid export membrane protein
MINKIIARVFVIILFVALLQFLGTIILARCLTKAEIGLYRLAISLGELGALISVLGLDNALVRFFSTPGVSLGLYDWRSFLKRYAWPMAVIITCVVGLVKIIYRFDLAIMAFILIVLIALATQDIFCALLRANKKYTLAIFSDRAYFIVFFALLTGLIIIGRVSFDRVLFMYAAASVACGITLVGYFLKKITSGTIQVPQSVFNNGFFYFGLGLANMLILQTGYLVTGKMLTLRDLGVYAVVASIMRGFEFVQDAFFYVLAPHLNARENINVRRIVGTLAVTTLLTAAFYLLLGKILLHVFFRGLYDEGSYLLPYFICVGIIRNTYIIPASILGGRSSERTLRNQLYFMLAIAVANFFLTYVCIQTWGLAGVIIAAGITWFIISAVSWIWTKKYLTRDA